MYRKKGGEEERPNPNICLGRHGGGVVAVVVVVDLRKPTGESVLRAGAISFAGEGIQGGVGGYGEKPID